MDSIIEWVVTCIGVWATWTTKRIYDLDKKMALNTQSDEAVSKALVDIKKSIEDLTKQFGEIRIMIAEEFGHRGK